MKYYRKEVDGFALDVLCTLDAEVNSHWFLHCKTSANLWNMFFRLLRVRWVIPQTTRGMLNSWKGIGRRESEED